MYALCADGERERKRSKERERRPLVFGNGREEGKEGKRRGEVRRVLYLPCHPNDPIVTLFHHCPAAPADENRGIGNRRPLSGHVGRDQITPPLA